MEPAESQSYSRVEARRRLAAGNRWVVWNPNAQVVTEDHAKRMVVPSKLLRFIVSSSNRWLTMGGYSVGGGGTASQQRRPMHRRRCGQPQQQRGMESQAL